MMPATDKHQQRKLKQYLTLNFKLKGSLSLSDIRKCHVTLSANVGPTKQKQSFKSKLRGFFHKLRFKKRAKKNRISFTEKDVAVSLKRVSVIVAFAAFLLASFGINVNNNCNSRISKIVAKALDFAVASQW